MSAEIFGINISAKDMYEEYNRIPACFGGGELNAVRALTNTCVQMNEALEEIIDDQNNYELELESLSMELDKLQGNAEDELQILLSEIQALEEKEKDGTITEDEQKELEAKRSEFQNLNNKTQTETQAKSDSIKAKSTTIMDSMSDFQSKAELAEDYGTLTVEKGQPLAETEVSSGFFKKLFGCTGAEEKEVGEIAVKEGKQLLGNVNYAVSNYSFIQKNYKDISN